MVRIGDFANLTTQDRLDRENLANFPLARAGGLTSVAPPLLRERFSPTARLPACGQGFLPTARLPAGRTVRGLASAVTISEISARARQGRGSASLLSGESE